MKRDAASLKAALAATPGVEVKATTLARFVPHLALGASPDWLFTSGKPNRYNPAGVNCVYFAETREVAQVEYDDSWIGLVGAKQPATMYFAEVSLQRVLDLTDAATLKALNLDSKALFKNWRAAKRPTLTQVLGWAVEAKREFFSAIRYPSKAAATRGKAGANLVIFHNCLQSPDSVRIVGPDSKPLQEWPRNASHVVRAGNIRASPP